MKKSALLFIICFTTTLFSQSITNTLDTGGFFYVKDASSTFLTLKQSNGYLGLGTTPNQQLELTLSLRMPTTTSSTTGVFYKGTDRFIHNYKPTGTGGANTFIGIKAGNFTMTKVNAYEADANTGVGNLSLQALTSGYDNSAFGYYTMGKTTTGYRNVALGSNSLYTNITGNNNTAVGFASLYFISSGDNNTSVGYYAGSNITTGSNLTCLGNSAQPSSATATNEITLGNTAITTIRAQVTSITSLSDIRDKKNINDLSLGLNFLMKLQPRQFNWDKREWYKNNKSDGTKMNPIPTAGFIAQELDKVQTDANAEWLNLVYKSNPNKWEATYGNLLPVIVKAVQELKLENNKLVDKTEKLIVENTQLKEKVLQIDNLDKEIKEIKQLKAELTEQLIIVKAYNKTEKVKVTIAK